jgi:CheY-like chemotaxis protein
VLSKLIRRYDLGCSQLKRFQPGSSGASAICNLGCLRECLESVATDYEIIILKDGEAALQFVEEEREGAEPHPCVIVLDLRLPKYGGLEILAAIRRTPASEHVTALIVSTVLSPEAKRQISEYGAEYAEKPNTNAGFQDLAKRIWELCIQIRATRNEVNAV